MFYNRSKSVSLHSQTASDAVALCASVDLTVTGAGVPEWVHLLPAGEILTSDGRGPYRVADADGLIAASREFGDRLPIDENHATDLAAPRGEPAPARGWIVELEARPDGIWGRVEWTAHGSQLVTDRAYRGLSPVIQHQKTGEVTAILRASLVNRPNLRGLTALHSLISPSGLPTLYANPLFPVGPSALYASCPEKTMDLLEQLLKTLGLPAGTTETQIIERVTSLHAQSGEAVSVALQSALDPIAAHIGLAAGSDAAAVLAGVEQFARQGGTDAAVIALQAELVSVTTQLNTLTEKAGRQAAETFVDGAIRLGRVGVKPMRDRYVTMHMADPAGTEELISAMPVLGAGGAIVPPTPPARDGEIALQAEQLTVARMLGLDPNEYAETLRQERAEAL